MDEMVLFFNGWAGSAARQVRGNLSKNDRTPFRVVIDYTEVLPRASVKRYREMALNAGMFLTSFREVAHGEYEATFESKQAHRDRILIARWQEEQDALAMAAGEAKAAAARAKNAGDNGHASNQDGIEDVSPWDPFTGGQ